MSSAAPPGAVSLTPATKSSSSSNTENVLPVVRPLSSSSSSASSSSASGVEPSCKRRRTDCPYLDTIDRTVLDFDFEKLCSVTLCNINVYACLVCGKYFQGRGQNTQAYEHSLQSDHHVFINLTNQKIYCLPDDYEVIDASLEDIKCLLNPVFTPEQIARLDVNLNYVRCLVGGGQYLPGFIGLNNIKCTDYISVVLQALVHVGPLRNFMIKVDSNDKANTPLVIRFGELVRKMWSPHNFKGQVSPHELLQAIQSASQKRFKIGTMGDPMQFTQWFLNTLHTDLGGTKKNGSSIIHRVFQGEMVVTTITSAQAPTLDSRGEIVQSMDGPEDSELSRLRFLNLSLDLPSVPLFKDERETNIIPQVPLFNLLNKYNGRQEQFFVSGERKKYIINKLPPYLVLHLKRFTKNSFFVEKNNTIVNFPMKNLDMRDYVHPLVQGSTRYDLVASIRHEGKPDTGCYSIFVHNKANDTWYEIQDLSVRETIPHLIAVSEAYVLIYERQPAGPQTPTNTTSTSSAPNKPNNS
ncbi:Peptidase C19, ubiquitin carboxyl-terminal hydrolase 2 [Pelomyxa schiedti]|nr:Peptidase C19, ubiquitin carboxyl-terminal hydrolase 2 [Pelomyxa schiedti]